MRILARVTLWIGATCLVAAPARLAADGFEEFTQARRVLQQQLRSKQPDARIDALKQLQAFPIAESVRLIHASLNDQSDEVREAAYNTLLRMSGNQEVCDTLMQLARKASQRKDDVRGAAAPLAVVLSSSLPSVQRDSLEFVDKTAETSRRGLQTVVTLADELGNHHGPADVLPLARLAKTRTFADQFGVRRAVVGALTRIHTSEAVGALIEMMGKVGGEAKADAVEYLTQITGQIFAMDASAWGRWWEDVKDTWEYPKRSVEAPYRSVAMSSTGGYYYGLPLFAERLVFVLDTSGSMTGERIAAAKRELVRAIAGLPDHAYFGVLVFNSSVTAWQKQLVQATTQSKNAAIHFVNVQSAMSNTASYDALEAAMHFDTEAIYFLSDGAPHGGKIRAPVDIVAAITAANRTRRISIYTIGVGVGIPGNELELFLKALAEENLGLYRRIDG